MLMQLRCFPSRLCYINKQMAGYLMLGTGCLTHVHSYETYKGVSKSFRTES